MPRIVILPEARQDLFAIWHYVFQQSQSEAIADRLIDRIHHVAGIYAAQPPLGELRTDLHAKVRCFPVGNYVVFYFPLDDGIEIMQVIHGARDIPAHFRQPGR
jgi:toxin ParE1/3/4